MTLIDEARGETLYEFTGVAEEERVLEEINEFDPELLQTNLASDEEDQLRKAFGAKLPDE